MRTMLQNPTMFLPDGTYLNGNILIDNDRIATISKDMIDVPAQTYDLSGYTLLPGFINTHVHLMENYDGFNEEKLKAWLMAGVTHLRDQGILSKHDAKDAVEWRDKLKKSCMYPTLSVCGKFITAPNGYSGVQPIGVTTEAEARDAVRQQVSEGVDHIKTSLDQGYDAYTASLNLLSQNLLTVICDEAHKLGKKVSAHVSRSDQLKILLDAGIDEAGHTCADYIPDSTLEYMVRNNIYMTPTLSIYGDITTNWGAPFLYSAMDNTKRFVDMGGIIGFGNDYIEEKPIWSPVGMPIMEIELLRKAGLSMVDIIKSATIGGAKIIGEEAYGKLEKNCIANLIAVKGDPLELPYLLSNVQFVMKDGIVVKEK